MANTSFEPWVLIDACDKVARRCTTICGGYHGSAWLFDNLARFFSNPGNHACVAITIPVYINLVGEGEATIGRDGSLVMRRAHSED